MRTILALILIPLCLLSESCGEDEPSTPTCSLSITGEARYDSDPNGIATYIDPTNAIKVEADADFDGLVFKITNPTLSHPFYFYPNLNSNSTLQSGYYTVYQYGNPAITFTIDVLEGSVNSVDESGTCKTRLVLNYKINTVLTSINAPIQ